MYPLLFLIIINFPYPLYPFPRGTGTTGWGSQLVMAPPAFIQLVILSLSACGNGPCGGI